MNKWTHHLTLSLNNPSFFVCVIVVVVLVYVVTYIFLLNYVDVLILLVVFFWFIRFFDFFPVPVVCIVGCIVHRRDHVFADGGQNTRKTNQSAQSRVKAEENTGNFEAQLSQWRRDVEKGENCQFLYSA